MGGLGSFILVSLYVMYRVAGTAFCASEAWKIGRKFGQLDKSMETRADVSEDGRTLLIMTIICGTFFLSNF